MVLVGGLCLTSHVAIFNPILDWYILNYNVTDGDSVQMEFSDGPRAEEQTMETHFLTKSALSLLLVDKNTAAAFHTIAQMVNRQIHYKFIIQVLTFQVTLQVFIPEDSSHGIIFSKCFYILNI